MVLARARGFKSGKEEVVVLVLLWKRALTLFSSSSSSLASTFSYLPILSIEVKDQYLAQVGYRASGEVR